MPAFPHMELSLVSGLVIDALRLEDAPQITESLGDPLLRRWLPLPHPYLQEYAEEWCTTRSEQIRQSGRGLVRAVRHDGELVGSIDAKRADWRAMTCELSYWTAEPFRGRGLMANAVEAFSRALIHDPGFERVELRIAPENASSSRVAEKAGFRREGVARNAGFVDAGRTDLVIWSRIPADVPAG